jgi:GT2 family glycosyltransferase
VPTLSWGLLVATHNRPDALRTCVGLALSQTRPPVEVVVVDSSADWQTSACRIAELVAAHPGVRCLYRQAEVPSLTVQRNQALAAAEADIVFMIDDDSFMHPTCAEEIMQIYEADTAGAVAGVQARPAAEAPGVEVADGRKVDADVSHLRRSSTTLNWLFRKVFMMGKTEVFIPYEGAFPERAVPAALAGLAVTPVELFGGFRMTYRRERILRERFDPILRYYCPGEDLDASHRVSRHGVLLTADKALLYHHSSVIGRLKRRQVSFLWSLNQAVLLRRHAGDQAWARRTYKRRLAARLATDVVKDLLTRRWSLPQSRGTISAWIESRQVFRMSPDEIEAWYPAMQERIVSR